MKNNSNTASILGTTANRKEADPTLYSTSFKKNKFYIFSKREPEESEEKGHGINSRGKNYAILYDKIILSLDIYNERPSKDDQQIIPIQTNHQIGSQVEKLIIL